MMPHCRQDSQFELFETTPKAEATPRLELPFQRSQQIDAKRLAVMLGVTYVTASRMIRDKLFRTFRGANGAHRIEYDCVVEYCDRLCLHYRIPRKVRRQPGLGRLRDRDVLPFPIDETISVSDVRERLDCSAGVVERLIDEGVLVAYQLRIDQAGVPFRIHAPSLERYIASLHVQAASTSRQPTRRS
jgi:hypothetical protein